MTLVSGISALCTRIGDEFKSVRAAMALDSAVVHKTGTETIGGVKTFSSAPVVTGGTNAGNPIRYDDASRTNTRDPNAHNHAGADINSGTVAIARIPTGTSGTTVPFGNDSRFSDARTPTAHNHAGVDINSGTVNIARIPTGTTGSTVPFGNDARFTDARTPTAHNHAGTEITSGTISSNYLPLTTGTPVAATVTTSVTLDASAGSIRDLGCTTATLAFGVPTNPTNRQNLRVAIDRTTAATCTVTFNTGIVLSSDITTNVWAIPSGKVLLCAMEYTTLLGSGTWVLTAVTVSA